MFPLIEPIDWILIYTFWITIMICFFLFVWMLKKLSIRFWYDFLLFKKNILWYFLSVFFFSRLAFVVWRWNDLKHIKNPLEFFVMNDYNFSLIWAIFWFFLVFYITSRIRKENLDKYIDWIALSFFFILFIWFFGALLWWQVYGNETMYGIEILYSHPFTPVPYQVPIFPLPIVYSIVYFILFSILYNFINVYTWEVYFMIYMIYSIWIYFIFSWIF